MKVLGSRVTGGKESVSQKWQVSNEGPVGGKWREQIRAVKPATG